MNDYQDIEKLKRMSNWTWLGPILFLAIAFGIQVSIKGLILFPYGKTKVIMIGLDGLDWEVMNPLIEQGRLPNLQKLIEEGTSGVLMSRRKNLSPIIWTTIATGKKREEHGIMGFFQGNDTDEEVESGQDQPTPYMSFDRQVPAVWNMMTMEDRTTLCLGWWVTWPAEEINGSMISSFSAFDPRTSVRRGVHAGEEVDYLTWPPELQTELSPLMIAVDDVGHEEISRFVNVDNWEHPIFEHERVSEGTDYVLPWTYATDLSYVQMAEYLLQQDDYDLSMVYIQGTDTTGHRFYEFRDNAENLPSILQQANLLTGEEETYRDYFKDTMDKYYEFADELIGRLLDSIDSSTTVVICSDHGFGPWNDTGRQRWHGHTFSGSHRDEGTIILWGPKINRGLKLDDENPPYIWDVLPTVLALLDMPIGEDMPGAPIMDAFDDRFINFYNQEFIESYDENFTPGEFTGTTELSEEYEERLRSLGYIQ